MIGFQIVSFLLLAPIDR